jgi:cell division septation protein DedD
MIKIFFQLGFLLLALAIFASGGCTKKAEDQPPSNRDGVSDGRGENGEDQGGGQQPSRPPSAPKGEVGRSEYTIQVGIFDRPEAADNLSYELRAKNISNFVQRAGNRWRVCVGRYYSRGRAESTLRVLHEKGFDKAEIITPEPRK